MFCDLGVLLVESEVSPAKQSVRESLLRTPDELLLSCEIEPRLSVCTSSLNLCRASCKTFGNTKTVARPTNRDSMHLRTETSAFSMPEFPLCPEIQQLFLFMYLLRSTDPLERATVKSHQNIVTESIYKLILLDFHFDLIL